MNTCGRLLLLIFCSPVLLLKPASVWAHAVPRSMLPAANAVLQEAPPEITIRFSERVEPRASSLQVLDSHGRRCDAGMATVVPQDPWLYQVTLPALAAGVYTVSWRVMSADDGHVTDGTYVFAVGQAAISGPSELGQVIAVTGRFDALARWLGTLGAVALMGMLTASSVFWRRRLPRVPPPLYVLPCLTLLLFANSLMLFVRLLRLPVEGGAWAGLGMLMASPIGQITAAKLGVTILLVGALIGYWWTSDRRTWCWALALALTVLLLVSDALVSHSAATLVWRGLGLGAELMHLLGVTLWVGGLWYFATLFWWSTFRESSIVSELAWAMPAFSILAVGAAGLLAISGLYLTQLHMGSLEQLVSTSYGRLLLAKLGVVGLMVALGGYHQCIVHPHLVSFEFSGPDANPVSQRFKQTLRIEALLGLVALLIAAFLGTTSPPTPPLPHGNETFRLVHVVDDAQLVIEINPVRSGPNEIRLTVTDRDGQPLTDAMGALLQLQVAGAETAPMGIMLGRESPGSFREKDVMLGMQGSWKGQLTVQRQGAYDLHEHFELVLTGQTDRQAPPPSAVGTKPVTVLAYLGIIGVTLSLLLISIRRLKAAIRRLDISHQHQLSQPDRS